jgi:LPXTG-motif cell wall-anchored protein
LKKYLLPFVALLLFTGMLGTAYAIQPYELSSEGTTVGGEPLVLSLTNGSEQEITVSGPFDVEVQVRLEDGSWKGWDIETLDPEGDDVLFGGAASMVIAPHETAEIAKLAPGLPNTWRSYESADHVLRISAWFKVDEDVYHSNVIEHTITPSDEPNYTLEMSSNSPTLPFIDEGQIPPEPIILSLTNKSSKNVTVTGPVVVQGTWERKAEDGQRRLTFDLIDGQESIDIPAEETREVVKIEAGAPWSWLNFYTPGVLPVTAWFQVDGVEYGSRLWESGRLCHVREGVSEWEGIDLWASYLNDPPPVDNEDGTATITATLFNVRGTFSVSANEEVGQCTDCPGPGECPYVIETGGSEALGPAVGLTKDYFTTHKLDNNNVMVETGEIIGAEEIAPGVYELTWSCGEGTHNICINPEDSEPITYREDEEGFFFDVTVSVQEKEVTWTPKDDGRYESQLSWPSVNLVFDSASDIDTEVSARRKFTSIYESPEGAKSVGIFLDLELVSGDLSDAVIRIEVAYNLGDLPPNTKESDLKLFRLNEATGEWEALSPGGVDTEKQIVWALVEGGFSQFAVFELAGEVGVPGENGETDENGVELPATGNSVNLLALFGLVLMLTGLATAIYRRRRANTEAR